MRVKLGTSCATLGYEETLPAQRQPSKQKTLNVTVALARAPGSFISKTELVVPAFSSTRYSEGHTVPYESMLEALFLLHPLSLPH